MAIKKPHAVELGFYELIPLGAFELRLNQLFSDAIGDEAEDGIEAEGRFQLTYVIFNTHRFGFESFHDFGNMEESGNFDEQSHTIGPLLKGDLPFGNFKYETGYRGGLSEAAPDHSLKFFLSRSF